jgi:CheY-like chemotaxis protein
VTFVPAGTTNNAFLADGGEVGGLVRSRDWSAAPLGPIEGRPQSLKTAIGIMLTSPSPVSILWGLQLGGALTIQSRQGHGAKVELWLPISATPVEATKSADPRRVGAGQKGVALLVDDEELVRLSAADMLDDLGYAVVEARSAEEAMELLRRGERFDLVVTDHLLPGMTGTDLARVIRAKYPALPVLLVSGDAEREGVDSDLPRLTKPFRKDELAASLCGLRVSN